MQKQLTQSELKRLLIYDEQSGTLIRRITTSSRAIAGKRAGSMSGRIGHRYINIKRKMYLEHRLVWLYVTGEWPTRGIDHVNGDPADNRFENLRNVSQSENMRNKATYSNNSTGVVGVVWSKRAKKWMAQIYVNRKNHYLGVYGDLFEAICARKSAENRFGFHRNHGRNKQCLS